MNVTGLAQRALNALGMLAVAALVALTLGGLGHVLDQARSALDNAPTYSSFGYTPDERGDVSARAVAASLAADQRQCQQLHGPHASALQLPDGSHRCADKHGRRLPRSVITVPAHQLAQGQP